MTDIAPLTGIKVVDMTEALAGPYCAMLLGDLGADVVKVERPGDGDQARGWGPPFLEGESAYFLGVNRNKRSIELDIKKPADLDVLQTLIGRADVFLTNNPRLESLDAGNEVDPGVLREYYRGNPEGRTFYELIRSKLEPLPPEYPTDMALFTVTFFYNEDPGRY